jgi:hypothetical protein
MKKHLTSRIFGLAALYCAVFCVLVVVQFSNKGSFSLSIGTMTVRGRYLNENDTTQVTDGIRIYFGGLEFSLNEVRGKGLTLMSSGRQVPVNPETLNLTETTARFGLPGGTVITFTSLSTEIGQELIINCEFANDVSEVIIPITPRRSSIVRDNNQFGIMHGGSRFLFGSAGQELEDGKIVLSKENSIISYRSRARQRAFEPADYIIAQANNYESVFLNWREESYLQWNQQAAALQNEFDIMGYCTEALGRRNYSAAAGAISREFISSTRHSFRSSSFVGGMTNAHRTFAAAETSKMNLINSLIRERSSDILKEEHILDYLFIRSNTSPAYDIVDIINNLSHDMITIDLCPGLLEAAYDIRRWRPAANNPVEPLLDRVLTVISENLVRDAGRDFVFVSSSDGSASSVFSLRLGKALMEWAQHSQDTDWLAIGRSLVLSSLLSEGPGAGNHYNIINKEAYYPKSVWLMDNGLWAWTAASSVRASSINGDINLSFSFPVNMSHHVIIRGVRPFTRIQIHDTDWRTDSQFERYDSSGWVYFPQDQTLVLKLRHRETVENIRIIYRAPAPVPEVVATEGDAEN